MAVLLRSDGGAGRQALEVPNPSSVEGGQAVDGAVARWSRSRLARRSNIMPFPAAVDNTRWNQGEWSSSVPGSSGQRVHAPKAMRWLLCEESGA